MTDRAFWDERFTYEEPLESKGPNQFLVELASQLEPGRALDAGCGTGENALWLAEKGWQVTGIDFSEVALRRAKELAKNAGATVDFVDADLRSIALEPGQYELVVVAYLHFLPEERRGILEKLALAVRPGGTLFIIGHDRSNLEAGAGGPKDPSILFTIEDLVEDLAALPVVIRRAERVRRKFLDANGEAIAIDSLVVATLARH